MPEPNTAQTKLIQYLNEAYGTEKQLETALELHIRLASRSNYKKRLQDHLRETKRHGREVAQRIRALGGKAEPVSLPGPGALSEGAARVQEVGGRALAAVQGQWHVVRGTSDEEQDLKNAKTEYASEAEEIATYTAIEALAESVGDRETAQLARSIRREEERMASFLERLIPTLTKAVATREIPARERKTSRRRRSTSRRSSSGSRSRSASASRSASSRSKSPRSKAPRSKSPRAKPARSGGTRKRASSSSRSRSSGTRSTGSRRRTR